MRSAKDILVKEMIAHHIDPRRQAGSMGTVFSQVSLEIDEDDDLTALISAHVEHSLDDPALRSATLVGTSGGVYGSLSAGLTADGLVRGSADIARALHELTRNDGRIAAGALVFAICEARSHRGRNFLAILKLDPGSAFRPIRKVDPDHHVYVGFARVDNVIPTSRERLQKAAIFDPGGDVRFYVLDRQRPGTEEPADFFVRDLFGAELIADSRSWTKGLYACTRRELDAMLGDQLIGDFEYQESLDLVVGALAGATINVEDLVDRLNLSGPARSRLRAALRQELPDQEFSVDRETSREIRQRRSWRTSDGVRLAIPEDVYRDVVEEWTPEYKHPRRSTTVTRIVLLLENLREAGR